MVLREVTVVLSVKGEEHRIPAEEHRIPAEEGNCSLTSLGRNWNWGGAAGRRGRLTTNENERAAIRF